MEKKKITASRCRGKNRQRLSKRDVCFLYTKHPHSILEQIESFVSAIDGLTDLGALAATSTEGKTTVHISGPFVECHACFTLQNDSVNQFVLSGASG